METRGGWDMKYTTRDIVIIAVIAAIAGIVNTGIGNVWYLLNASSGPLGGAILQGVFMWAYVLIMWLVRRPGAALILGIIETSVELLLGNAAGIGTLGWGLCQGLGIEIVMALSGYRKYGLLAAMAAGAGASQFGTVWTAIFFGWDPSAAKDVWMAMPINLISGLAFGGILGSYLSRSLAKTGLIRSAR